MGWNFVDWFDKKTQNPFIPALEQLFPMKYVSIPLANYRPHEASKWSLATLKVKPTWLMVEESCNHQLRLVIYPIIYKVLASSQVGFLAGFLNHQQPGSVFFHSFSPIIPPGLVGLLGNVRGCYGGSRMLWQEMMAGFQGGFSCSPFVHQKTRWLWIDNTMVLLPKNWISVRFSLPKNNLCQSVAKDGISSKKTPWTNALLPEAASSR